MNTDFTASSPHSNVESLFKNIFYVKGSLDMAPKIRISRNMIIVKQGLELTLINPIRLNDAGLKELDSMGTVTNIIKLGAFHLGNLNGIDDAFYIDRYQAKMWTIENMPHPGSIETDYLLDSTHTPLQDASIFVFESSPMPEAILFLPQDGGILITADSLQNWHADEYFSEMAQQSMDQVGFFKPANIGPEWFRVNKPNQNDFRELLKMSFQHLVPGHGTPIRRDAKQKITRTIDKQFK